MKHLDENSPYVRELIDRGAVLGPVAQMPGESPRIDQDEPEPKKDRKLVEAAFVAPGTWLVPVYVAAGDNFGGTGSTKRRIGRSKHERWAVHQTMARQGLEEFKWLCLAIHNGYSRKVLLTRLGPRRMDHSNVVASLKYVQDAVAERFGVDDGDPRWHWEYAQEISDRYGVRIEIS